VAVKQGEGGIGPPRELFRCLRSVNPLISQSLSYIAEQLIPGYFYISVQTFSKKN